MMLKPFKVHSPDGKTFYEGDATPSPIGEDAANGAMGEREAFEEHFAVPPEQIRAFAVNTYADPYLQRMWLGWQHRAALTAENGAMSIPPASVALPDQSACATTGCQGRRSSPTEQE